MMYLIYLDESGSPSIKDKDRYYSIGGLLICEKDWVQVNDQIQHIKETYKISEIHTRKLYTKNNKPEDRKRVEQLIGDTCSVIAQSPLTLFCVTVDKYNCYQRDPDFDVQFTAWKLLLERLNISVDKRCKEARLNEFGLLMMDETIRSKDVIIRNYIRYLRTYGTGFQIINRIIEDPIFGPSEWRNLSQIADTVVTCGKYHLSGEAFFTRQFLVIRDRFAKNNRGEIEGAGFVVWN